jgi:carbon monoxide dehydrogenase subunit G
MTKFESLEKSIPHPPGVVFDFLSNFNNFESLLPRDKISNWQSTGDTCRFTVQGIGELGLKIVEKTPSKTIKYSTDGKTPFNFFLWIQLGASEENNCRLKLTLNADLNPMLEMLVSDPIKKFLEIMANSIANYHFQSK